MNTATLIRWAGLAAIAAGLLFALGPLIRPGAPTSRDVDLTAYAAGVLVVYVGHAVTLLGLVGLFARQVGRGGPPLVVGFLLTFLGTALGLIPAAVEAILFPYLTSIGEMERATTAGEDPPAAFIAMTMLPALMRLIGYVMFGVAIARIGVLPRAAGLLVAVGGPLFVFLSGPWIAGQPLSRPGGLLLGAGLVWLGSALWADAGEERRAVRDRPGDAVVPQPL